MGVERIFVWCRYYAAYVAFAHGANDRSNAIGPMAAVYQVLESGGELMLKRLSQFGWSSEALV